jgi:hypothetical protein
MRKADEKINAFNMADSEGIATLVDLHSEPEQDFYTPFLDALKEFEIRVKGIVQLVDSIDGRYFEDKTKVPKKPEDFAMYIIQQMYDLEDKKLPTDMLITLMGALTTIENSIPMNELDPMKIDEFDNLIEMFKRPDRYYYFVKSDNVVSPENAMKFAQVFPETYNQVVNIIIDKYDNMAYNKAIKQLNNCALQSDDQELVTLCTNQYNKGA